MLARKLLLAKKKEIVEKIHKTTFGTKKLTRETIESLTLDIGLFVSSLT